MCSRHPQAYNTNTYRYNLLLPALPRKRKKNIHVKRIFELGIVAVWMGGIRGSRNKGYAKPLQIKVASESRE